LGFEIRTIFMSCLLLRLRAIWLLFQNFSIACFVWTMSVQSAGERRTDVATHDTPHVTITKWPCQSWSSQSPASHRRGPGSIPGAFSVVFVTDKKETLVRILLYYCGFMSFTISPLLLDHSSIILGVVNWDVRGCRYSALRYHLHIALQKV